MICRRLRGDTRCTPNKRCERHASSLGGKLTRPRCSWRRRYSVVICIFELSLCIARSQYDLDIITELENRLEALGKTLSPHGVFYVNGKGDIGCTPAAVGSSQMARQLDQQMRCSYCAWRCRCDRITHYRIDQGRLLLDRLILSAPHAALPIALVERHASELVSNARKSNPRALGYTVTK
jgi:hypothetical protein